MDGWMASDFMSFSIVFQSGRLADDNVTLYAMEPRLRLRTFRLERGSSSGPLDR